MLKTVKNTSRKMPEKDLSPLDYIIIEGAKVNNLKNISLSIPRNKFITITGLSGSGKSSLAFDTLFAEGQRRYVESLSAYIRQFMGNLEKPLVDKILGISPAIAIEQKVLSKNPRSTVGTVTEIYDYLKLLYARIGKTYSPISNKEVFKDTVSDVVDYMRKLKTGTKVLLHIPMKTHEGTNIENELKTLMQQGFNRIKINEEIHGIEEYLQKPDLKMLKNIDVSVIIDRIIVTSVDDDENINRLSDSVLTAFYEGEGICFLDVLNSDRKNYKTISFSNKFELDGITFEKPVEHFFSFNNPYGACSECEGFGSIIGIDSSLVVPNKSLSVYEEAIACWKGEKMKRWKDRLLNNAAEFEFPIHRPFSELSEQERDLLWTGNKHFKGLNDFFKYIEKKSYKIQYRVMLSRYRGKTKCPQCRGTRIRPDASFVKINEHSITDLLLMPSSKLLHFFENIKLNSFDKKVGERLLFEIITRLKVLCDVGLDYLTLNRSTNTLSGGESQRINLSSSLGSSLVGSMYILDEPSVGLHPRDTARLIKVLLSLKDIGNTVIVVEHDEDIMKVADQIIDLGLYAGSDGGNIVFQGDHNAISRDKKSITASYLNGTLSIDVPSKRRSWTDHIKIEGASENNLNHIDARFPLGAMTVVTGVSGSGKSSLVKNILFPAVHKFLGGYGKKIGDYKSISGSVEMISSVEFVDQNPIGKSSRSNPVTYVKAYDDIRRLFADQQISIQMGFKPSHFSFNVEGGRCEECEGEGKIKVEMQFMADIQLLCDSCKGLRFKKDILSVRYQDKNIADILNLTIDEAIQFFEKNEGVYERSIVRKLMPLQDVGMGYIKMGQPSSTLSGGEAQRVKLATFLGIKKTDTQKNMLFIFDEPTTGLHFHDIKKLLQSFNALINQGHSIVIIEHNLEVVKNADWIIDLGPEGGDEGGNLVFEGIPEEIIHEPKSYTGRYLAEKL